MLFLQLELSGPGENDLFYTPPHLGGRQGTNRLSNGNLANTIKLPKLRGFRRQGLQVTEPNRASMASPSDSCYSWYMENHSSFL